MIGWHFFLAVLISIFYVSHDLKYPASGIAQGPRKGSVSLVFASTQHSHVDYIEIAIYRRDFAEPPLVRPEVHQGVASSREGRKYSALALSKVHADEEAHSTAVPHLPVTLAGVLRPDVCPPAPQAAGDAILCFELARTRTMGLSHLAQSSYASAGQGAGRFPSQACCFTSTSTTSSQCKEAVRCWIRGAWERQGQRGSVPASPLAATCSSVDYADAPHDTCPNGTDHEWFDHVTKCYKCPMFSCPAPLMMPSMPSTGVPTGPTAQLLPMSMPSTSPPQAPTADAQLWEFLRQRKATLPADVQQEITKREGAKVSQGLYSAADQLTRAREDYEQALLGRAQHLQAWKNLAKAATDWQEFARQFVQHEKDLQDRISVARSFFSRPKQPSTLLAKMLVGWSTLRNTTRSPWVVLVEDLPSTRSR